MDEPPEDDRDTERRTLETILHPTPVPKHHSRAQLVVLVGDEAGRAFAIDTSITIGRAGECDVVLAGESSVSRRHARIFYGAPGRLFVEDLRSRNGTLVNGVRVDRPRALDVGDRVQVGGVVLLLTQEDPLQDLLRERQKMEAIGRLAAAIAHDFNNVTAATLTTCEHLAARLQARGTTDPETLECITDLRAGLEHAAELTRSLATLGRRKTRAAQDAVDVSSVCEEVARLCDRTLGPAIKIVRQLRSGLYVRAHRTELHQILLNLCLNARDAMPRGGLIRIGAEHTSEKPPGAGGADRWVVITVTDTGEGMTAEVKRRIFEPFFTTKREGRGTGLGLATVISLVTGMNGVVDVQSQPGQGSAFRVWLPADTHARRPASSPQPTVPRPIPETARQLLLIEDEDLVRRSLLRMLTGAGYRVIAARSGVEALKLFTAAEPRPRIVLLDLDMPEMSGEETLEKLLAIDPELRVIVVSGHWDPDRKRALLANGAVAYLGKPFEPAALRETLTGLF